MTRDDETAARLWVALDIQKARHDANEETLRRLQLEVKDFGPLPPVVSCPRVSSPRNWPRPRQSKTLDGCDRIPLRLIVFFARLPDEALSDEDVCEKFGALGNSGNTLKPAVREGWIARSDTLWEAGPRLLQEIGQ